MNKIEMGRNYTTRDKRKVRILCVDGPSDKFPVVGCIDGNGEPTCWTATGLTYMDQVSEFETDLIEVPETLPVEFWVNVYKNGRHAFHRLKAVAEHESDTSIFARIHIKLDATKGSGL